MTYFLSELISEDIKYNEEEILEVKWMDINQIKSMKREEFRSYPIVENIIQNLEDKNLYSLDIFNNLWKV